MHERLRRFAFRGLLVLVWAGVGYYLFFGGVYGVLDILKIKQERREAVSRVDSLIAATDSLTQRGDSLASDPLAVERTAREEYGLIRKGEVLVRFDEARTESAGQERSPSPEAEAELDEP